MTADTASELVRFLDETGTSPEECAAIDEARAAVGRVRGHLEGTFADKSEVIDMLLTAATAFEPMLLVGDSGTAKTAIVSAFCAAIGVRQPAVDDGRAKDAYFEYALNAFTEPYELFGPLNIAALEAGRHERDGRGMLQSATVAFLDEVFKGGSAILNTLLGLINERRYSEAGENRPSPLQMVFGASNSVPVDDHLVAFYDRFTLRVPCVHVARDGFSELVARGVEYEHRRSRRQLDGDASGPAPVAEVASIEDLRTLHRAVLRLLEILPKQREPEWTAFVDDLGHRVWRMRDEGVCAVSDRRVVHLIKVLIARTVLHGRWIPSAAADYAALDHIADDPLDESQRALLRRDFGRGRASYQFDWSGRRG